MTPYHSDSWLTVWQGDCREVMAQMEPESVHCVVTSPPYWGLRDYGIEGQLGLEPSPEEYVANMVAVFREVRRVLRADGTCWVNLGDSYAGGGAAGSEAAFVGKQGTHKGGMRVGPPNVAAGLKPKDLVGIPWRVAFALQADGWYLRSDIIWSKPNPMPESVTDRPTKAHEYLFLLSKSARYYYDADAVREPHLGTSWSTKADIGGYSLKARGIGRDVDARRAAGLRADRIGVQTQDPAGRNLRSVWSIATQPYPGAHFATFPEALVEPCVKAGTSERGVCPECGAPWRRVAAVDYVAVGGTTGKTRNLQEPDGRTNGTGWTGKPKLHKTVETTGWRPSCSHDLPPVAASVLDPFAGSGTTGRVAQRLGRRAVLIDLSGDYLVQAMRRNAEIPLSLSFSPPTADREADPTDEPSVA